jgi:regulatory protein
MSVITKISAQNKNKNRVNLYLDGEFFCGLDMLTVLKRRLKEGGEISADGLNEVCRESEGAGLFEKCVSYVCIRPRAEREVRAYLKEKGAPQATADEIVEKLRGYNYVDDAAFARFFTECHKKNWGMRRIEFELKMRGVSEEIIAEVSEESGSQDTEAAALAEKYVRQHGGEFDRRKLFNYLFSKGFDSDTIKAAIEGIGEDN